MLPVSMVVDLSVAMDGSPTSARDILPFLLSIRQAEIDAYDEQVACDIHSYLAQ